MVPGYAEALPEVDSSRASDVSWRTFWSTCYDNPLTSSVFRLGGLSGFSCRRSSVCLPYPKQEKHSGWK